MKKGLTKALVVICSTAILMMSLAACIQKLPLDKDIKSVDAGEEWVVTESTSLSELTIAGGASIKAPRGYSVTMTVDGVQTELQPGTYRGDIILSLTEVKADFAAQRTEVDGPTTIQFFDKSKGKIVSREWDFNGDGEIDSDDSNPAYTYTRNGEYSVTLTVKTANGTEDTVTKRNYIKVTGCGG